MEHGSEVYPESPIRKPRQKESKLSQHVSGRTVLKWAPHAQVQEQWQNRSFWVPSVPFPFQRTVNTKFSHSASRTAFSVYIDQNTGSHKQLVYLQSVTYQLSHQITYINHSFKKAINIKNKFTQCLQFCCNKILEPQSSAVQYFTEDNS